jgi:hypothetical protein
MDTPKSEYNKTNYFRIPENYFANNEAEILGKIQNKPPERTKHNRIIWAIASSAAIITICFIIWKNFESTSIKTTPVEQFSAIDKKVIEEYLLEHLSENDIIQLCADHQINIEPASFIGNPDILTESGTKYNTKANLDTSINSEDIIDYLNDENIEIETL